MNDEPSVTLRSRGPGAAFRALLLDRRTRAVSMTAALLLLALGCRGGDRATGPEAEATRLEVAPASVALTAGETVQMVATPVDENGNPVSGYEVSWTSGDTTVVTVDGEGMVTGRSAGSTSVTAAASKQGQASSSISASLQANQGQGSDNGKGKKKGLKKQSEVSVTESGLITNLEPAAYEKDTLQAGDSVYVDRAYSIDGVPSEYRGWRYVRTANDDKDTTGDSAVTFTLTDTARVALAYDIRATTLPDWLRDWTATGDTLRTSDVEHLVYTRVFAPGDVALGGNMSGGAEGAQSMYVLSTARSDSAPEDTTSSSNDTTTASVESVDVSPDSAAVPGGDSTQFDAAVYDSAGNELAEPVTWASSDTTIATVDTTGLATGRDSGVAYITATADGVVDSARLAVDTTGSQTGSLEVITATTGDSLDADGYMVYVDGGSGQAIGISDTTVYADLEAADHTVELADVASNCSVSGSNPRTVSVTEDDTVSTTFEVGCTADSVTASGQIVVDPDNPSWLMYEGGAPFVMSGPGDPEGFLYRGSRNSDGTREGDQLELIDKLGGTAANSIYLMAVRSHGGDGGSTENPFLDSTPGNGLNQDILDQWETWFTEMEKRGITIFFIFYDDSSNPWGDSGNDSLSQEEEEFVQAMVDNFTHHENLIWAVAEEYSEAFSQARVSNFAAYLRSVDPNDHPIAVHQHAGTTFDFADDPNVDIHAMQLHSGDVGSLHADVQQARDNAAGRYHVGMYEWGKGGSGTPHGSLSDSEVRQGNWASIMGGATVMDFGMDIDSTPLTQLEQAGYIVSFFERTDIHRMSPDDSRVYGSTEWVLADDPDSYVLYTRQGGSDPGLTNLEGGTYDLLWLDTVTGTTVRQTGVDVAGGNQTWTPPSDIGNELALYVDKN